jgi:hypothetical protein
MRVPNPYRPGFNQVPVVLAGRDDVLDAINEALAVAALDARTPRPVLITGTGGVGKTVVLDHARRAAAEQHSWLSAAVEIQPGLPFFPTLRAVVDEVRRAYAQHRPDRGRWKLTKTTLKAGAARLGAEAEITRTHSVPTGTLREDVEHLMEIMLPLETGLMITIDEAHLAAKDELAELAALLQHAVGQDWPLVAIIAGLPSIQSPQRMVTYLERAEWHTLGMLNSDQARTALVEPARDAGRPMDDVAADTLTAATGGYPYAIQVFGHHAWRRSHGQDTITAAHANAARPDAERDLANGLYNARWNDTSPKEKEYLIALAQLLADGQQPIGADIARALGQPHEAVGYLRERLVQKGTIYAEGRALRLAVPGMAPWILHQPD